MKRQINPTIKAHLLRSAFYLLLLVAICAIPFALAQSRSRGTAKRSVATPNAPVNKDVSRATDPVVLPDPDSGVVGNGNGPILPRTSQIPLSNSGTVGGHIVQVPPPPAAPQVVLYDQYNNAGPNHTRSTTFTDLPTFSIDLADDFVVPAGQTWNVQSIDADGTYAFGPGPAIDWNVFIYTDSGGLPGTQIFSATQQPVVVVGTTFTVNLPVAAVLSAGTYWVEIQANMTFTPQGEWEWTDRMLQSNSGAALRNPGGDVGCGTDWIRKIFCVASMDPDQVFRLNGTLGGATPTPTPTATATAGGCQFHVLVAYSDTNVPTQLQSEILAQPNVVACDLFDAQAGTPTLAQLQQYQIVVPYSNFPFFDADTLGNNLADYVDGGGIVVQYGFSHYGPGQPYGINGRWASGNYNPYSYSTNLEFNSFGLGTHNAAHPLMAGVTTLNSNFANIVTLAAGATEVAANTLGESLVAFRPVGAHTTVGVTAYVGSDSTQSGDWGKVIVNAGNWLANCQGGSPTPTPTATATATFTPTPTPTATFTPTPTPTPTPLVQITLHARGYKVHGLQTVDLFWSGPTSGNIDIYRNGALIVTVPNQGGFYTDHINRNGRGTYTYRVCEAGTSNCSNQVTVRF